MRAAGVPRAPRSARARACAHGARGRRRFRPHPHASASKIFASSESQSKVETAGREVLPDLFRSVFMDFRANSGQAPGVESTESRGETPLLRLDVGGRAGPPPPPAPRRASTSGGWPVGAMNRTWSPPRLPTTCSSSRWGRGRRRSFAHIRCLPARPTRQILLGLHTAPA